MMLRTSALALALALALLATPSALAAWTGEDAAGDAALAPANAWADLVAGAMDGSDARIELAGATVVPPGSVYLVAYASGGAPTYCAAVEDVGFAYVTGGWDDAARRPTDDVESAEGSFASGSPAVLELASCRAPDPGSAMRFLTLDSKTYPLGLSTVLLDEMDALESPPTEVESASTPTMVAEPEKRAVPLGAGLALLAALLVGRRRGPA